MDSRSSSDRPPGPGGDAAQTASGLEPLGDPDDDSPDFADEHQQFVVDTDDSGSEESESPSRYAGGLEGEGPP